MIGWDVEPSDIRRQLNEAKGEDIEVEMNTRGGSVFAGFEIYNMIKQYAGKTSIKITSLAASMGSYIALAFDHITAESNAVYMIHNASVLAAGDHNELRKAADHVGKITGILAKAYAERTGKPIDEIRRLMDAETFYYGSEIKEAGFADETTGDAENEYKETAIELAKAEITACMNQLSENKDRAKDDLMKAAAMLDVENPFPNEHACRIKPPENFTDGTFRRVDREHEGKKYSVVMGKLKGKDTMTDQSYRYNKTNWTESEAKTHCSNHGGSFEAASNAQNNKPAQEKKKMADLTSILNEAPEAKKEFDNIIASKDKRITEASKYIGPESKYPASIQAVAMQVLKGEQSVDVLTGAVIAYDALTEKKNSDTAATEQAQDTAAQDQQGQIEDDVLALAAQDKKAFGINN